MAKYHDTMETLAAVSDAVEWVAATCMNRLNIPEGLDEYEELDKEAATAALQIIILPMSRDSPFGRILNHSVLLMRKNLWWNEDCIIYRMTTLQEHCGSIGIISSTICGTQIVDCRQKIIVGTKPFMVQNTRVTTNPYQQKPLVRRSFRLQGHTKNDHSS
ncbi:hypothetical protein JG687_00015921 [Phytophthora cactorum]|uniref:Uncharacterized protein n=1 Tax=Phytophthora cactorum TaxID=29920 RepID=A0A8T1TTE4_9STRA|nr:hypothetical protein JG687_00015921 [Phytophthora cactorum]